MKRRYISVNTEIQEYIDVDVSMQEVKNNLEREDVLELIEHFGMELKTSMGYNIEGEELYRYLCDVCGVCYHTAKDDLINKLKEKF